jgi:hypothetical protein
MQVGAETLPSGYLPLPALVEPVGQAVMTHGNDGKPIWKMCLILLKLQDLWHFYKINL